MEELPTGSRPNCPCHQPSGIHPCHRMTSEGMGVGKISGSIDRCFAWEVQELEHSLPFSTGFLLKGNGNQFWLELCSGVQQTQQSVEFSLLVQEKLTLSVFLHEEKSRVALEDGRPLMSLPLPCLPGFNVFLLPVLICLPLPPKKQRVPF